MQHIAQKPSTLLIVGMHRSGTSAVSNILSRSGFEFGTDLISAGSDNPDGFFEDRKFVKMNDDLLGGSEQWWNLSSQLGTIKNQTALESTAVKWVENLGERKNPLVALKDPRLCLTIDFWANLLPKPKILFLFRNPATVANSLQKRNGGELDYWQLLWAHYNLTAIKHFQKTGFENVHCVDFDDLVADAPNTRFPTLQFLGLKSIDWSYLEEGRAHRLRPTPANLSNPLSSQFCRKIYNMMKSRNWSSLPQNSNLFDHIDTAAKSYGFLFSKYQVSCEQLGQMTADRDLKIDQLNEMTADRDQKLNDFLVMKSERDSYQESLQAIYNSNSWKLTAPARYVNVKRLPSSIFCSAKSILRRVEAKLISHQSNLKFHLDVNKSVARNSDQLPLHRRESLKIEDLPDIQISIVTYNNSRWLDNFMGSLKKQLFPLSKISIAFVDNSSTDNTFENLMLSAKLHGQHFKSFDVCQRPNHGFGAGHDYAITTFGKEKFTLVSNIDLEFLPDTIVNLVSHAIGDDEAASWECRQMPWEHPKYYDPVTLSTNWSSHACILLNRNVYHEVGGYDKNIFMYGEDVEYSYRLRNHGYQLRYTPSAPVMHYTYDEEAQVKPLQFTGSLKSNMYIRLKYGSWRDVITGYVLLLGLLVRGAGVKDSRKIARNVILGSFKNLKYFLFRKKVSDTHFGFTGFDYDITRDGAFFSLTPYSKYVENKNYPKVTVVTRTFKNRCALLRQAMISVYNQTYPNIEHIVIEDGGSDNEIIAKSLNYLMDGGYTVKYKSCEKLGRSAIGNLGMQMATGEYLVILDDDDLLFPDHIETLMQSLIEHDVDASYSLAWDTKTEFLKKEDGVYSEKGYYTLPLFYQEFDREVLKHHNYFPIQAVLFKKNLFNIAGGFDEDMEYLEDWVFWKKLAFAGKFRFAPKTTSIYRTPYKMSDDIERRNAFHDAYETAKIRPKHIFQ